MKYSKLPVLLEITWLVLAIMCLILAIQNKFWSTGDKFVTLLIFAAASFLLYIIRRNRRNVQRGNED